jgi:hypothetical protein
MSLRTNSNLCFPDDVATLQPSTTSRHGFNLRIATCTRYSLKAIGAVDSREPRLISVESPSPESPLDPTNRDIGNARQGTRGLMHKDAGSLLALPR